MTQNDKTNTSLKKSLIKLKVKQGESKRALDLIVQTFNEPILKKRVVRDKDGVELYSYDYCLLSIKLNNEVRLVSIRGELLRSSLKVPEEMSNKKFVRKLNKLFKKLMKRKLLKKNIIKL